MAKHLIIAGVQRGGTTWLYTMLDQHPEISMVKPARPELKFFLNPERLACGYAAYRQYFDDLGDDFLGWFGEKSTSYIEFPDLPSKIQLFFGGDHEVRFLFMLRHPIRRAISNVGYSQQNGLEDRDLEQALRDGLKEIPRRLGVSGSQTSVDPKAYLERGLYWQQLEPYFTTFGNNRLKVVLSENTFGSRAALQEIFRWLEVDDRISPVGLDTRIDQTSTNGTKLENSLPPDLWSDLYEYYREPCWQLTHNLGLDLSKWGFSD